MCTSESLGELLTSSGGTIPQIDVVPKLMHKHMAKIKTMEPIQIDPAKGIGMKKYAAPPVVPVKGSRTAPAFQLLFRSR